ncbi:MAG TPA: hypothetical protein VF265_04240, partial [Nevskiaceae bacterium]
HQQPEGRAMSEPLKQRVEGVMAVALAPVLLVIVSTMGGYMLNALNRNLTDLGKATTSMSVQLAKIQVQLQGTQTSYESLRQDLARQEQLSRTNEHRITVLEAHAIK